MYKVQLPIILEEGLAVYRERKTQAALASVCDHSYFRLKLNDTDRVLDSRLRGCRLEPHLSLLLKGLVLVQPRKTCPDITEKLLTGT